MEAMGEGAALFCARPEAAFGHDTSYRYRPDPDLHYLTGFPEPEAALLLDADRKRTTLFVRPRDRARETWEGLRAGPEGAVRDFGVDEAFPAVEMEKVLAERLRGTDVLWLALGESAGADALATRLLARFRREARHPQRGPRFVKDPTDLLHEMRLVKTAEEIALLERAAEIAVRAHRDAMAAARPGRFEYQVEAAIERRFKAEGASGPAYATIVASGENATILHYVENRRRIGERDLVLVDAGCEYEGYASDVTRTFPASGRFTPAQRTVYDAVLAAQKAAIAAVRPGALFDDAHAAAREVLVEALAGVGLLRGRPRALLKRNADARFVLHRTSHWLGRDVHDRGRYTDAKGRSRKLEPGMVLTVEPGLYIRTDEKGVSDRWRGIGVRIEDDVLVTEEGARVLTSAAPREREEVENAVAGGRRR